AAIGVGRLVGIVLVDAGVQARLAGSFLGVFRIDRVWKDRIARRHRRGGRRRGFFLRGRGGRCRRGRGGRRRIGTALGLAEVVPLHAAQRAVLLGGLVLGAAFLRGQRVRRCGRRKRSETGHRNRAQQSGFYAHPLLP